MPDGAKGSVLRGPASERHRLIVAATNDLKGASHALGRAQEAHARIHEELDRCKDAYDKAEARLSELLNTEED